MNSISNQYISTRNPSSSVSLTEAILNGMAPDGGLYLPNHLPMMDWRSFLKMVPSNPTPFDIANFADHFLSPFFAKDHLYPHLESICKNAFNFPLPIKKIKEDTSVLELFNGPTAAFKDVGARFLAESLTHINETSEKTILVATSGDTGSAVASAFDGKENIKVIILYPQGMVSSRQEHLLTCWSDNVVSYSVKGTFDDCQRMVKEALRTPTLQERYHFVSANSINIGRLLPQMVYYAWSSLINIDSGYIIPSGNLGNATAALMVQKMGFPIREVVLSTNANTAISSFFETGIWKPHSIISTLANAMDVGTPNNMERILFLYPDFNEFKKRVGTIMSQDEDIKLSILNGPKEWGEMWCPHTATAVHARSQIKDHKHWTIVATAHPAKFQVTVESILSQKIPVPTQLENLLERPSKIRVVEADMKKIFF